MDIILAIKAIIMALVEGFTKFLPGVEHRNKDRRDVARIGSVDAMTTFDVVKI